MTTGEECVRVAVIHIDTSTVTLSTPEKMGYPIHSRKVWIVYYIVYHEYLFPALLQRYK